MKLGHYLQFEANELPIIFQLKSYDKANRRPVCNKIACFCQGSFHGEL